MTTSDWQRWMFYAAHLARVVLGFIFLAAGALKALDVAEFAHQIAEYGLVGPRVATFGAPLLIALECTLAVALIVGWRPRAAAAAIGGLLVFFIGLEAWALSQGKTESCGCFGAYMPRTPAQVIVEDLLFLGLAMLVVLGIGTWQIHGRRLAGGLVAGSALLSFGFALASPRLPIDSMVTELKVGKSVEELKLAHLLPDGGKRDCLVALFDLTAPGAKDLSEALNTLQASPGAPAIVALTPSTETEEAAFRWDAYPAFDIHPVARPELKRLYRRLPLYLLVRSGRVERIFEGPRPPGVDLLSSGGS